MTHGIAATNGHNPAITRSGVLIMANTVTPRPVEWLWQSRFPIGKLSLVAGDPGLGKSLLTLDTAARLSVGRDWADGSECTLGPSGSIFLSAEDDAADTLRPRLDAAGADPTRVGFLAATRCPSENGETYDRTFDLSKDIDILETTIAQVEDCRLIVIDPITAYLGATDSHKNADVRALLAPLSALAARARVAVVAVTHLNKATGVAAVYRTMGSLAFPAAARAVWAVVKDSQDPTRRLVLPVKSNLAKDTAGMAYRVIDKDGHPLMEWEPDAVFVTTDQVMSGKDHELTVADMIEDILPIGEPGMTAAEVHSRVSTARNVGLRGVQKALSEGVKAGRWSEREGDGSKHNPTRYLI